MATLLGWRLASRAIAATASVLCLASAGVQGPDEATRASIQASLDTWRTICGQYLHIDPEPLPWMIFYDEKQSWHLGGDEKLLPAHGQLVTPLLFNGRPRQLLRVPHDNTELWVPSGTLPIGPGKAPHVFAMPYDNGTKSFFVLALPSVVRAAAGDRRPSMEQLVLGLAGHELAHTRQLVDVMKRIKMLRETHDVPIGIDDNFIQKTYSAEPEYTRVLSEEGASFFRAAMEDDREASRRLLSEALSIAKRRRAKFFTGDRTVHAELDDIFLVMEGIGEWVRFQIKRQQASPGVSWRQTVDEMMVESEAWSQQQGLVLFLLIDRHVPNWQARFFSPTFPSPFTVLGEAVATPTAK